MREILFRGKDKDNNWIYGYFNRFTNYKCDIYPAIIPILNDKSGSMSNLVGIKEETVGQYTGLTDKNGKKIFEGDIVEVDDKCFLVVQWSGAGYFELRIYDAEDDYKNIYRTPIWDYNLENMKIIGNIWDNPEMIKENENE